MVSVEVAGPQESSDGSEEMISEREIGAMVATCFMLLFVKFAIMYRRRQSR